MIFFVFISVFIAAGIFTALYNLFYAPVIRPLNFTGQNQCVSVLIPVRNESLNIEHCLHSVTGQNYQNIEIIVLDDMSEDDTYSKAFEYSKKDNRIKVIKGKSAPSGWKGKSWACMQLSHNCNGSYLLFIDADVCLSASAVGSALSEAENSNTDLLSVFPEQVMKSFGEKITVQILNWLMISFLPVKKVFSSPNPKFAAANGQFMFFKRSAYLKSGGHALVSDKIVEDIEFSRILKKNNYKVKLMLSKNIVSCRMYLSLNESINGFTKNYFPGSSMHPVFFILTLLITAFAYLSPLALVFFNHIYIYLILIILIQNIIVSYLSTQNIVLNLILFPFQIIMMVYIGFRSLILLNSGKVYWKNRKL